MEAFSWLWGCMLLANSSSVVWLFPHPGEMPPCLICAYVMENYESTHTFLVCLFFLMMHTLLNTAYWGFMVCSVEVFCYIKARQQAARLSVNHSGNRGICSHILVIVCYFYFDCLTYIWIHVSLEFSASALLHLWKISRPRMHVSILILTSGICFLVLNGDSSNYPTRIPCCESLLMQIWNVVEVVWSELDECGGVDDEQYVT